ncbi:MAG: PaaI family thioesterase [Chloroflexota bacterium]
MTTPLDVAREVLASQPFSVMLGTEITHFEIDNTELRLEMKDEFKQQNGFAHGGIISYLADNALTFAGGRALGIRVLTSEYKINYVKPGRGKLLIARASVISASKRQAVCRCDVFAVHAGSETLCATAQGTIVVFGS